MPEHTISSPEPGSLERQRSTEVVEDDAERLAAAAELHRAFAQLLAPDNPHVRHDEKQSGSVVDSTEIALLQENSAGKLELQTIDRLERTDFKSGGSQYEYHPGVLQHDYPHADLTARRQYDEKLVMSLGVDGEADLPVLPILTAAPSRYCHSFLRL